MKESLLSSQLPKLRRMNFPRIQIHRFLNNNILIIFSCTPPEGSQDCCKRTSPKQTDIEAEARNKHENGEDDDVTEEDGEDEEGEAEQARGD